MGELDETCHFDLISIMIHIQWFKKYKILEKHLFSLVLNLYL